MCQSPEEAFALRRTGQDGCAGSGRALALVGDMLRDSARHDGDRPDAGKDKPAAGGHTNGVKAPTGPESTDQVHMRRDSKPL